MKFWHFLINVRLSNRLILELRFYGCCHPCLFKILPDFKITVVLTQDSKKRLFGMMISGMIWNNGIVKTAL